LATRKSTDLSWHNFAQRSGGAHPHLIVLIREGGDQRGDGGGADLTQRLGGPGPSLGILGIKLRHEDRDSILWVVTASSVENEGRTGYGKDEQPAHSHASMLPVLGVGMWRTR
jgi:hypothetical protein